MLKRDVSSALETKFCRFDDGVSVAADGVITGYASVFGLADQGGDIVESGAYGESLVRLARAGRGVTTATPNCLAMA